MSLRLRLTLLYSLLTGGILLLLGVAIYLLVGVQLIRQTDYTLFQTVQGILENTFISSIGDMQPFLPNLDLSSNVFIQFWNSKGELESSSPNIINLTDPLDSSGLASSSTVYRNAVTRGAHLRVISVPLVANGHRVGLLQAALSLAIVDQTRRELINILIGAAASAMLLAGLASWFGIGRALAPLDTVTETALQISQADDLSRRIPYSGKPNDEVGKLITAFNETLERLERLFASQQRFLADVSHELRTPLTVIKGNADLMQRMKQVDDESLDSIREEADRLTRLVGDLLLEAQAESGKLPLNFAPFELDTLLLDVYKEMRILAHGRVSIKVTDIDQVQVNGDRDRLKQVLVNLVSNAIKYTPEGGEIYLSLGRVSDQARLVVRDTGPGIPTEDLPHIFERFYRAEKSRSRSKIGGFGLGLSIAYWIITHHGGRIEVDSAEGKGSTFCIWLPTEAAPENMTA
jgi:two-component system, OmpR family, sensor kinase